MRILIYSANFAPETVGIGRYSGDMADWLADQRHDVRVVAAPPYYPEWKIQPAYRGSRYRRELWRGISIWRAPIWVPSTPGRLKRILHLLSFAVASLPVMLRQIFWRPNLVIVVVPAFLCAPAAWIVARTCGAQAWLHVQDFEIDIAFKMFFRNSGRLKRAAVAFESWMLRRFDHVSTISHRMVDRLISKGVAPTQTRHFPNWVDISHIRPSCDGSRYRAQLGIAPDTVVLLYSGSFGAKHGLMSIPAVARRLARRADIVFVVCGEGVMKRELTLASELLPNMRMLDLQPYERLGELLCMADIHLLPQSTEATDLVLPSKLSGMLASGRPVIATCSADSELDSVVPRCGIALRPGDDSALADAIVTLADDRDSRMRMGERARDWAQANFQRDAVLADVFGFLSFSGEKVAAVPAPIEVTEAAVPAPDGSSIV